MRDIDIDQYPKCKGKKQSPINIDTSTFDNFKNRCDVNCKLAVSYQPSDCHITNENNIATIYFNGDSYISYDGHKSEEGDNYNFGGDKNIFNLKKATLHTPSMHTINSENYDLEIMLYHYSITSSDELSYNKETKNNNNNDNDNDTNWEEENKGIIVSLFYKIGHDKGEPNDFFSQFMNRIPTRATKKELRIPVNDDWGPKLLLPKNKGFFTYAGSLPKEPCNENWYYIVFEEAGIIGKTLFEAFKLVFARKTNRITQRLNERTISYNNSAKFDKENFLMINEINEKMKDLKAQKRELVNELDMDVPEGLISQHEKDAYERYYDTVPNTSSSTLSSSSGGEIDLKKQSGWYVSNKITIKYTIISISFVLFMWLGYYTARYIILTGVLPNFLTNINKGTSDTNNNSNSNSNSNSNNNNNNNNNNNEN